MKKSECGMSFDPYPPLYLPSRFVFPSPHVCLSSNSALDAEQTEHFFWQTQLFYRWDQRETVCVFEILKAFYNIIIAGV